MGQEVGSGRGEGGTTGRPSRRRQGDGTRTTPEPAPAKTRPDGRRAHVPVPK